MLRQFFTNRVPISLSTPFTQQLQGQSAHLAVISAMRVFERAMRTHLSTCRPATVSRANTSRGNNLVEQFGRYVLIQEVAWWTVRRRLCRTSRRCNQGGGCISCDDGEVGYVETYGRSRVKRWRPSASSRSLIVGRVRLDRRDSAQ
jgi:hypothetical protein